MQSGVIQLFRDNRPQALAHGGHSERMTRQ